MPEKTNVYASQLNKPKMKYNAALSRIVESGRYRGKQPAFTMKRGPDWYYGEELYRPPKAEQLKNFEYLSPAEKWMYRALPGFTQSSVGKALESFAKSPIGKALGWIDVLAEGNERFTGLAAQGLATLGDPQHAAEFRRNLKEAWYAGTLAADTANLSLEIGKDASGKFGIRVPQELPGLEGMVKARRRIAELVDSGMDIGDAKNQAVEEYYNGIGALAIRSQSNDLLFHVLADPINVVTANFLRKPVEASQAARKLIMAQRVSDDVLDTWRTGLKAAEASGNIEEATRLTEQLQNATRRVGKTGNKLVDFLTLHDKFTVGLTGGEPIYGGKLSRKWYNPFALTPAARAHELMTTITDNVNTYLFSRVDDPYEVARVVDNAARQAVGPQLGHAFLTPEGRQSQAILGAINMDIQDGLRAYDNIKAERVMAQAIADQMGVPVDAIVASIEKGGAETLSRQIGIPPEVLERMAKNMKDVPYTPAQFKWWAMNKVADRAAEQAIIMYGVKAKGLILKSADALKAAETLAFLRLNPAFLLRNTVNNEITTIARGMGSYVNMGDIEKFWDETMNFEPVRLGQGYGMIGETIGKPGAEAYEAGTLRIYQALRGDPNFLDNIKNGLNNVRLGKLDMGMWAQEVERNASRRAMTLGYQEGWKKYFWRPGYGYDRAADFIPSNVVDTIENANPGTIRQLENVLADAWTDRHIDDFTRGNLNISMEGLLQDASKRMGFNVKDSLPVDFIAGIEKGLKEAVDKKQVREYFQQLRLTLMKQMDEASKDTVKMTEDFARAKIAAEGPKGLLSIWGDAVDEFTEVNLYHSSRMENIAAEINQTGNLELANKMWNNALEQNNGYYKRAWDRFEAMLKGMKKGASDVGYKIPDEVTDNFKEWKNGWRDFYIMRNKSLKEYFDAKLARKTPPKMWDELQAELDDAYSSMVERESQLTRGMDDLVSEALPDERMKNAFLAWRDRIADLRRVDKEKVIEFRESIKGLLPDERERRWQQFWQERYQRYTELWREERKGAQMLSGDAATAEEFNRAGMSGANVLRRIAKDKYNISTAYKTKAGQYRSTDKHLLAAINKYLPEGTPKFTRLDDVPVDVGEEALRARAATPAGAAQLPLTVENMRETFKTGLRDIYKLPEEEIDNITAVMDARAEAWASNYGNTAEEWWKTRIGRVQQGGVGQLYQEGITRPIWYSQLQRVVDDLPEGKVSVNQLKNTMTGKGVKADELEWTGFNDWLAGKKSVDKQEALDFLKQNEVRVEEVMRGERLYLSPEYADKEARLQELVRQREQSVSWYLWDQSPEAKEYRDLLDELARAEEKLPSTPETKYGSYVLPGGENYRELLLTLPHSDTTLTSGGTSKGLIDWMDRNFEIAKDYAGTTEDWYRSLPYEDKLKIVKQYHKSMPPLFTGGHWEEPNVLAHVRFNDRVDVRGKKMLHVEEVQSDWLQTGKERGFKTPEIEKRLSDIDKEVSVLFGKQQALQRSLSDMRSAGKEGTQTYIDFDKRFMEINSNIENLSQEAIELQNAVPPAPFADTWPDLTMKRVLRYASEKGYDGITWTTGEQQVSRYPVDLKWEHDFRVVNAEGKPADYRVIADSYEEALKNQYVKDHGGQVKDEGWILHVLYGGQEQTAYQGIKSVDDIKKLPGELGEKWADKTWAAIQNEPSGGTLKPLQAGMEKFYDETLPKRTDKYVKKWGAKVGETKIYIGGRWTPKEYDEAMEIAARIRGDFGEVATPDDLRRWEELKAMSLEKSVHSLDITPEMRKSVLEGQPLFQGEKGAVSFTEDGRAILHALESPDISTVVHEVGHIFRRDLEGGDLKIVEDWAGVVDSVWERPHEEKFARAFERYLADGIAPTKSLQSAFEKFKNWLTKIYKQITGSQIDVEITPEVRRVFDNLLTSETPPMPSPRPSFIPDMGRVAPSPMPVGTASEQAWMGRWFPALDQLEQATLEAAAKKPLKWENLPADAQEWMTKYLDHVKGQMADARYAALRYSEFKRDSALLNYNRRFNYNTYLGVLLPFEFWFTQSAAKWALHTIDRPAMLASYYRIRKFLETAGLPDQTIPTRMKGTVKVPLPFLPDWMLPFGFVDPVRAVLPFDQYLYAYEQYQQNNLTVNGRIERLIQKQVENGDLSKEDADQALSEQSGYIWENAKSQVMSDDENLRMDPMDFMQLASSPHAPLVWAHEALRGTPERIGPFTPMSRTIKGVMGLMGVDWDNSPYNLEARIRKQLGLPAFDRWDTYRVERMLSSMAARNEYPMEDITQAFLEHSGPVWEEATRKANVEFGVGAVGGALGIPVKSYPEGEEKQRNLKVLFDRAYNAYDKGDPEALNQFFLRHPEYEARLALFKKPEERLRRFLVDNIWDIWNDMPKLQKDAIKDALGDEFQTAFIDKNTRSYDSITPETMQLWLKLMGGNPPGTLNSKTKPVQLPPPDISWRAQMFYDTRNRQFPTWYDEQEKYFMLAEGKARKAYLRNHPSLPAYWDWRRDFLQRNPDIVPYVDERGTFEFKYKSEKAMEEALANQPRFTWQEWQQELSPEMQRLIEDYANNDDRIPYVLEQKLEPIADKYGIDVTQAIEQMSEALLNSR